MDQQGTASNPAPGCSRTNNVPLNKGQVTLELPLVFNTQEASWSCLHVLLPMKWHYRRAAQAVLLEWLKFQGSESNRLNSKRHFYMIVKRRNSSGHWKSNSDCAHAARISGGYCLLIRSLTRWCRIS